MPPPHLLPQHPPVHVIGASGRSGQALCRAIAAAATPVIPVIRNPARATTPGTRIADLTDPASLRAALHDATRIVSCAHARHIPAILAAAATEARLICLGSTRKFTRWPDAHGNGVLQGEAALLASNRPGLLLHPTMIYGAQGEDNVRRLAALLRRLPLIPLPGGGHALVQPIHQDDVTACLLAALAQPPTAPETLVIAGPTPVPYRAFVAAIAHAANLRPPRIVPLPATLLIALAPLTRLPGLPGLPRIGPDEIRRLLEHKAFDIAPMRARLGVIPRPLAAGLAQTFGAPPCP